MNNSKRYASIIIMGVSGSGKSTIGRSLATRLGIPFVDADDHHPARNLAKMKSGIPLTDQDREPWLLQLSQLLSSFSDSGGVVLACSALKKSYREILKSSGGSPTFVYLRGGIDMIQKRMRARDHFMPESLLISQFETLEEPDPKEAITVSVEYPVETIVEEILASLEA